MNARNGKIARLPREIREELNERLERSEAGPQLLAWLNGLKEVKKLLRDELNGVPISKQNLSEWRQGGFQEWLARRDLCEHAEDLALLADKLGQSVESVLADDAATVLSARLGSLIAGWNGEVDQKFEARARVLNGLCRSVVQLQRGAHRASRESFELQRMAEEKEKDEKTEMKHKLLRRIYDALSEDAMAKTFGGGTLGLKMAKMIMAIQRGNLDADVEFFPNDTIGEKEPAATEAAAVKPAREERTVQQAGKTSAEKAAKPLNENEIAGAQEAQSSQDQSKPVKVGQTLRQ